ncbi:MAG: GNAT family N-acetyltransferase [Clostridia bacterium]|nr:GNAT family N-acetyltransferase [Clostridia bacterium]
MEIEIRQITSKSEEFFAITNWFKSWWRKEENLTCDETQAIMENSICVTEFPRTYALFVDKKVVGAFQFTLFDLHVTPNIYPWLANVYVDEGERGKGYSKYLLEGAVQKAKEIGFKKLWLFTSHVGLYERYGFEFVKEVDTFTKNPRIQRIYVQNL